MIGGHALAGSGLLLNVSATGTPADVSITLCLNGKGPLHCQNYSVSGLNLTISPAIPNQIYPSIGVKINTPGYTLGNLGVDCAPSANGYCLFSASQSQVKTLSLVVDGPLTVSPTTLPFTTISTVYNQTITASGGLSPYQYALITGALPPGLSLSTGGVISGTATEVGTYSFTLTATDANTPSAKTVSQGYTLQVYAATPTTTLVYSSVNPSVTSSAVTLSANVSSSNGAPSTGSVGFTAAGAPISGCTAQPLTSGIAICTTSSLGAGPQAIVATYTGGGGFAASTSASFSQSVVASVTATVPAAPQAVTAIPGNGHVTVNWSPPANTGGATITGYTVQYGTTTSATFATPGCSTTSSLSCIVSGLSNGISYTFTVVAANANGSSPTAFSSAVVPGAVLTVSPAHLALSGLGGGVSRTLTITNHSGSNVTLGAVIGPSPSLPSGTTVNTSQANACVPGLELLPSGICTMKIVPGSTVTSGAGGALCTTGIAPIPSVVTVTDSHNNTVNANIVVLGYGCQYQEGYLFAIDDTLPVTGSIGGTVAALTDQADQSTGIVWSSDTVSIWGIDEISTLGSPSPNASSAPSATLVPGQLNCNAATDGACATHNVFVYGGAVSHAVSLCKTTLNGYTDWYLPSICEMGPDSGSTICTSPPLTAIVPNMVDNLSGLLGNTTPCTSPAGCLSGHYWSSTQDASGPDDYAWYQFFASAGSVQHVSVKQHNTALGVRCARALTL
jgi:hypothetical protein